MRGRERIGIVELGQCSILSFFLEHPIATYSAALAYRGRFPFLLILVMLGGAIGFPDLFDRAADHAQDYRWVPGQLEPVVEPAREQIQPLLGMLDRAEEKAGSKLLFFGVGVALWSVSAVARTLTLLGAELTVVYRFGPNARQRFRSVALAAALAVTLWTISSGAFAFYLANFANIGFA